MEFHHRHILKDGCPPSISNLCYVLDLGRDRVCRGNPRGKYSAFHVGVCNFPSICNTDVVEYAVYVLYVLVQSFKNIGLHTYFLIKCPQMSIKIETVGTEALTAAVPGCRMHSNTRPSSTQRRHGHVETSGFQGN